MTGCTGLGMVNSVERSRGLRGTIAAALTMAALALAVLTSAAGASPSQIEQSGQLTMTSDPGDYIGQGLAYSFATPTNVFIGTARSWHGENNMVSVTMRPDAASTDYWILEFAAPPGETLTTGSYSDAVRVVSQGPGRPGLDVFGVGRGCNALTGSFTVSDALFGPYGYVQSFRASFEQHCEGHAAALRGEVSVSNPPPPPPLKAEITIASSGQLTRHGSVIVNGTISCNRRVDPDRSFIQLLVSEPSKTNPRDGAAAFAVPSDCSPTPSPWQATVYPTDPKSPFTRGTGTTTAWVQLGDPFFDVLLFQDPVTAALTFRES
jgi:hypothetical protein